jgi:hypothetical protein
MRHLQSKRKNKIRAGVLILFLSISTCGIFYSRTASGSPAGTDPQTTPTPRRKTKAKTKKAPPEKQPVKPKFTEFPHDKHQMDCDSCHKFPSANWESVRKTDAFPDITDYPRHESCLTCHREQFFKGEKPAICSICHTDPSPQGSPRHPFPNPREIFDQSPKGKTAVSDFQIFFPHDKHIDIVSRNETEKTPDGTAMFVNARMKRAAAAQSESCGVCHQTYKPQGADADEYFTKPPARIGDAFWLKKGTFKTVPTGHQTCFTCHSADTGISPAPTDCATCHKPDVPLAKTDFDPKIAEPMKIEDKIMMLAWRERDSSATFRHEFSSHADMDCTACHNVTAMNTIDPLTKKVAVASCSPCHITATTDDGGILNFEVDARKKNAKFECVKCHMSFGRSPIPESHFKAISDAQ